MRSLTENQKKFLAVFEEYNAYFVDNLNVMAETGWGKRKVVAVGQGLVKRGLVEYTPLDDSGFEGGVWELLKRK